MDKICFLNSSNKEERIAVYGFVKRKSDNVIEIKFKDCIPSRDVLLSGFDIINEFNGVNMTNDYYHNYNTLYREVNEFTVMLSNDKSVFIELETPEVETYVPTLEDVKVLKINNFSSICNARILNGVDVQIGDVVEHFSYTEEDQVNLKEIFDLSVQTNIPMYYHADGQGCKSYDVEQIIAIYSTATTNKMHHTTYFNQMKMYINSLETIDEVQSVEYGQELTGEYLETYNESMAQAQLVLEALLDKRESTLSGE